MLDSKQLALVYLMEECNKMSAFCAKNIHNVNKRKINIEIEKSIGVMFNAMKEVGEEFKVDEPSVEKFLLEEIERRNKER
jgi:hypothetical protein